MCVWGGIAIDFKMVYTKTMKLKTCFIPITITLFLTSGNLFSSNSNVGTYNNGKISFTENASSGNYTVEFSPKNALNPIEMGALAHLHMTNKCGKKFLFLDQYERRPSTPNTLPVVSALVKFHCQKEPNFFNGNGEMQSLITKTM